MQLPNIKDDRKNLRECTIAKIAVVCGQHRAYESRVPKIVIQKIEGLLSSKPSLVWSLTVLCHVSIKAFGKSYHQESSRPLAERFNSDRHVPRKPMTLTNEAQGCPSLRLPLIREDSLYGHMAINAVIMQKRSKGFLSLEQSFLLHNALAAGLGFSTRHRNFQYAPNLDILQ